MTRTHFSIYYNIVKKVWGILLVFVLTLGAVVVVFIYSLNNDGAVYAIPTATSQQLSVRYYDDYKLFSEDPLKRKDLSYNTAGDNIYSGNEPIVFYEYNAGAIIGTVGFFEFHLNPTNNLSGQKPAEDEEFVRAFYYSPFPQETTIPFKSLDPEGYTSFWDDLATQSGEPVVIYTELEGSGKTLGSIFFEKLGIYRVEVNTMTSSGVLNKNSYVFIVRDHQDIAPLMFKTAFIRETSSFSSYGYLVEPDLSKISKLEIEVEKNIDAGRFAPSIESKNITIKNSATDELVYYFDDNNDEWVGWFHEPEFLKVNRIALKLRDGQTIKKGVYTLSYSVSVTYDNITPEGKEEASQTKTTTLVTAQIEFREYVPRKTDWWYIVLAVLVLGALGGGIVGINKLLAHTEIQHSQRLESMRMERRRIEQENIAKLRAEMEEEKPAGKKTTPKKRT